MNKSVATLNNPCAGCGACVAVCPTDAINMSLNGYGFFSASVDGTKCIDCGKCQKVCIRNIYDAKKDIRTGTLVAMQSSSSETVMNCTSGGIAFELAINGYRSGKVVAGTIYDYTENIARMVIAESEDDILSMRGSKYVQSNPGNCVQELILRAKREANAEFIIFGTPCQIYGIDQIALLNGIRERFVLVDLFCHGVPSYLVWNEMLRKYQHKAPVGQWQDIRFRDSREGWHNFVLSMQSGEVKIKESSERSYFYHAFFDNILLSKSCFDCKPRCVGSGADIRLGDFWGKRYQDREDGVSAVVCLTDKGRALIKSLEQKGLITMLCEAPIGECLKAQSVEPYPYVHLQGRAIEELRMSHDLKKTIKRYRMSFPIQKRIKLLLKEATGLMPVSFRRKLKQLYRKV